MANKYTNRTLLDYNFNENDYADIVSAKQQKLNAENAYNNHGDFVFSKQDLLDKASDALTNRKQFSYDLNADVLYQQYKDNYINQGKQAMMDTMGQAAAMTGGYGNSYAATVGNQTYQGYLQNLNNIVPDLYQMAMERYNLEGNRLQTAYDVLKGERKTGYDEHMDKKNVLYNNMVYGNSLYDAAYTRGQTDYNNKLTSNNDNYWNEYNTGYKAEQDAIANQLARDQYELSKRSVLAQEKANTLTEEAYAKKYEGWLSPEMQAAKESPTTNKFIASVLTPQEFASHGKKTTIDGNSKRFDNYNQYIDALLDKWYDDGNGELTEKEVEYLKGVYGLTD